MLGKSTIRHYYANVCFRKKNVFMGMHVTVSHIWGEEAPLIV